MSQKAEQNLAIKRLVINPKNSLEIKPKYSRDFVVGCVACRGDIFVSLEGAKRTIAKANKKGLTADPGAHSRSKQEGNMQTVKLRCGYCGKACRALLEDYKAGVEKVEKVKKNHGLEYLKVLAKEASLAEENVLYEED